MENKDVLGLAPYGEALKTVVEKSFEGLYGFLSTTFQPAVEEFGYMMKDKVRYWRLRNALRVMAKAKDRIEFDGKDFQLQANARVGLSIIDESSMVDDDELQNLWAGLFASSCTPDGRDDSNIIFVDILKRLSSVEVRILSYACEHCRKLIYPNQLVVADTLVVDFSELQALSGIDDCSRLDRELDHLSSLSLLVGGDAATDGGFISTEKELSADITPSALALNLYCKTHSLNQTVSKFWEKELVVKSTES